MSRGVQWILVLLAVAFIGVLSYWVVLQAQPLLPGAGAAIAGPSSVADLLSTVPAPLAPTVAPSSTATSTATPLPTATPSPSPTPTPAYHPAVTAVELTGLVHAWQTWNNCGPATLSMYLSYWGLSLTQDDIAAVLRPNPDDKNVSPEELADFARSQGLRALVGYDGRADQLRLLLSNGIPVIIETWHEPEPDNGMGHYRLLVGYDDTAGHWIVYDSYDTANLRGLDPYRGLATPYEEVDQLWPAFNRVYVVIYAAERESMVRGILGEDVGTPAMWEVALSSAEAEVAANPEDVFAWFNLGTDLTRLGRYAEAADAYRRAEAIGWPPRMLWYQFEPFQAFYQVGQYDEVIRLTDQVMAQTDQIEEVWYWRGLALAAQGDGAAAQSAFDRALTLNPDYAPARDALS